MEISYNYNERYLIIKNKVFNVILNIRYLNIKNI